MDMSYMWCEGRVGAYIIMACTRQYFSACVWDDGAEHEPQGDTMNNHIKWWLTYVVQVYENNDNDNDERYGR